ncbi:Transducin/WD40 repeat-like superfamily protein [Klebsormidium nitens]|uniref:Transducin/WD40 repeat-like superfamily protein n=1 Tax=Klebsormidium nitens TaxID=105231 RepID=A0A1Y1I986_KLENI|nr:Transducin/WD40 repeat-like superfamily protein [Klebsormidium nitens]|eukprot:GAQ87113.1 Transducin/WD40 repeat-like superfamily protein [Klebsormidium nitens]
MMEQVVCLDTTALVAVPVFPNSVRWSEENLLAAAAGHLVTILDPSSLSGPRGYITLPQGPKQDIGEISDEDSTKPSVFPLKLRKETQTHIRSIDWSPQGFAPDAGCLLAVCTSAHDVRIFRRPISELTSEWIEVANISALYHGHCTATGFADAAKKALQYAKEDTVSVPEATWQFRRGWQTKPMNQHRKPKPKIERAPKVKKEKAAPKAKQLPITKGAVVDKTKGENAALASEESEGANLTVEKTAGEADARNQGAGEGSGGAPSTTGVVKGDELQQANMETEVVGKGEEPRIAGTTADEPESLLKGGATPPRNVLGLEAMGELHRDGDGSSAREEVGRREGLILDEAHASDGPIDALEGQKTEKLRSQGGTGAPGSGDRETEDLLFGEKFLDGVRLTDMLMGAETGKTGGLGELEGGAKGREADGPGESMEKPSASAKEEANALKKAGKARRAEQSGNERAAGLVESNDEPDKTRGRRGRKRTREMESTGDASPRATRRRSTRQKVEGVKERSQGENSGDESRGVDATVVAAVDKRGGRKKQGGRPTEQEGAADSERAQGSAVWGKPEGAPTVEREPVLGEAGSSEKGGRSEKGGVTKEADRGGDKDAVEAGGGGAPLREPLDAGTAEDRGRSGTSADTALETLSKTGQDAGGPGGSPDQLPDVANTSSEPSPPTWQLGSVSGPVLSTDAVGVGTRVEVLQTEEGLAGAWFAGMVVSLGARKKAQVEYDELLENEETGEKLREWIPLQPVATVGVGGLAAKAAGKRKGGKRVKVTQRRKKKDDTAETAPAEQTGTSKSQTRPRIRPETSRVDKAGQAYAAGDYVEVFIDDAWWEGLVVGCKPGGPASVYFPGDGNVQIFELGRLRLAWGFRGLGRGWAPLASTVSEEATKPAARRRVTKKVKEELLEDAPAEPRKKGVKVGGKKVRQRKKAAAAEPLTTGGLKLPKVENEEEYGFAALGREEKAALVREHERLAGVLCERFRVLREGAPAEALPEYQEGEHLKGRDKEILEQALAEMVAQEGDQLNAARLTVKELVKLGRQHIRRKVVITRKPKPEVKQEPMVNEGTALGPRKRKRINYATLGGDDDLEDEPKAESSRKGKRKKLAPVDEDEEFQARSKPESDSDSDIILATKTAQKKGGKRRSEAAIARNREQSRQRYQKKREGSKGESKRLAKAKTEHAPGSEVIPAATFAARSDLLAALTVAWSPKCHGGRTPGGAFTVLAVGSMSGHVALWKVAQPLEYGASNAAAPSVASLGTLLPHDSWVSALGWAYRQGPVGMGEGALESEESEQGLDSQGLLILGTGSSDGSVRLWSVAMYESASGGAPPVIQPAGQVCAPSGEVVSSLSLRVDADVIRVAAARGAGELLIWQGPVPTRGSVSQGGLTPKVTSARPSGQPLMGLGWAAGGEEVCTCSQEGGLQRWQLDGVNSLLPVTLELAAGDRQFGLSVPTPGLMRGYTGLALSPNGLAIAGVRTLALGALDTMYQTKAMRGALQLSLCGRGGIKPGLGKRPRGKLSATAEAAIQALAAGREKPLEKRDWLDEFLTPADSTDQPGESSKAKGKEGEEDEALGRGKAVGEDSQAEDERRRSAAEKLTSEVVRSVERILRSGGPVVLWDVMAALKEVGVDALRQVLAVVRKAARGKEPGRGTSSSGGLQSAREAGTGLRKDAGSARQRETENGAVETREPEPELQKKDLRHGENLAGAEDGLSQNQEGEAAIRLQDENAASVVGNGVEGFSLEAEGTARRALQVLNVLLLKLGATLDSKHGDEDRALRPEPSGGAGTANHVEPSTTRGDTQSVGLLHQELNRQLAANHPGGNAWQAELRQTETELRMRLAESLLARLKESSGPVTGTTVTSAFLWADWARAKGAPAGPRLQKLADDFYIVCGIRLPSLEEASVAREVCPFCSSPVLLDSPDTARCSQAGVPGTSTRPGVKGHKFKRCMVTMLIQSSLASWQCSCCRRIRTDAPFDSGRQPLCGFCGVLMHRPLPEPFLRPALCG